MARPPGGFEGEGMGCIYYFCCGILLFFCMFGTTKHHHPFDLLNKAPDFHWSFLVLLVTHKVYTCKRLLPKPGLPTAIALPCFRSDALRAACWIISEGRATISSASWLSQKPQLSKGEVVHAFDPCYCYHLFTDQHFKPYLWLAGHVSGLSEAGYSLCGFLMIYLDKICGMREMKLSALLYGTSVHVTKWKYFQKRWRYFESWHKFLRQRMSLKGKEYSIFIIESKNWSVLQKHQVWWGNPVRKRVRGLQNEDFLELIW